jgi:very-short-patch-repair endonuclease
LAVGCPVHQRQIENPRQHGIGDYIVDFYSPELNLVIEVDGESHYTKSGKAHDKN